MRNYFLAAVAAAAIASPAVARDGSGYVGIEGGLLFPKDNNEHMFVDYTTTQAPATPLAPAGPADAFFEDALNITYDRGLDVDLIAGYDAGFIRFEGEVGWKRANIDEREVSDNFLVALNTALNRPGGTGDLCTLTTPNSCLAPVEADPFDVDGKVRVLSFMANALLDFGADDGFGGSFGLGFGRANVRMLGESDSAWAWQFIAGLRAAVSSNIDVGLKYRFFRTAKLDLTSDEQFAFAGNADRFVVGPAPGTVVNRTTNALITTEYDPRFISHSLLASLIFNFAPPPPPPPPPAAAPATQTCPDGSVILATDVCPAPPPPPPPPPPPAGERG